MSATSKQVQSTLTSRNPPVERALRGAVHDRRARPLEQARGGSTPNRARARKISVFVGTREEWTISPVLVVCRGPGCRGVVGPCGCCGSAADGADGKADLLAWTVGLVLLRSTGSGLTIPCEMARRLRAGAALEVGSYRRRGRCYSNFTNPGTSWT